jgi:4-amino-4-deoxy-L-arabinose transferase-like glycosyltransferase
MTAASGYLLRDDATARRVSRAGAFLVFAAAIGAFASLAPLEDVLGWSSLLVAASIIGLVAWRHPAARAPLLVGFVARTAVVLIQSYVMQLPGSDADAIRFEFFGWAWSQGSLSEVMQRFTSGAYLYSWIIAVLYWIGGRSAFMAEMLNVLFGTLIIVNVFKLATLLRDERAGRSAAWVAALFPTMVLFSGLTMREVAVTYPLTLGVLYIARWRHTHRPIWVLAAMIAFGVAVAFHIAVIGVIAMALLGVGTAWLLSLMRGHVVAALRALAGLAVAAAVGAVIITNGWGGYDYIKRVSIEEVRFQQQVAAVDRAAYLQGFQTMSPVDLLWQAPIRAVYLLFTPFPWWVRTPVDLLGLLDAVLFAWLLWKTLSGIRWIWRDDATRTVLMLFLASVFVFAIVVSNYGTAIRHRGKAAPLLIPLAFAATQGRRRVRALEPRAALASA